MATVQNASDLEYGSVRDGYPALASWIARDPDHETFVFRKFDRLGARNILHLQCQLTALENELNKLDEEARRSNDLEAMQASRRYETLTKHAQDPSRREKRRLEIMNELEDLLKRYYETLLLQSQIEAMKGPSTRVLSTLRDYIDGKAYTSETQKSLPIISGLAKDYLYDRQDLISLHKLQDEDLFSRLLRDHWIFQKRNSNDPLDRTSIYRNIHVEHTVAAISMAMAAVLLIGAMTSLNAVSSSKAKLGLVSTYTLLFALSVAFMTNAKRAEVFAATAAYAAVLVVFVSGDLGGGSKEGRCLVQMDGGYFNAVECHQ